MRCPYCGHEDSRVVDSRVSEAGDAIRRRRECQSCTKRFTTYERREEMPLMVVKRNGEREPFERHKLQRGLMTAAVNRDISSAQLEAIVSDIEAELHNNFKYEVSSQTLGDMALARLKDLDKVAYIRFASVYKSFQDLDEFLEELRDLR
jgi:transcriptional repressor NrdR